MEPVTAPTDRRDVRQVAVSPYVRILVHNGQNVVSTVALLDPGCETSLISKELALVLDLTGKQTKIKRDWPMFIQTVKSMIHDVFPTDVQRLTMLSTMLAPPIRVGMSQIFNTPQAYRSALQELHRKYGHPQLVVRSYIRHLMSISVCDGGDGLETFSTQLNGAVATLDASGYGHELESSVALESLAAKLPGHLITRWGRNVT